MLQEGARCGYYEKYVLPEQPKLEALYWADRKARAQDTVLTALQIGQIVRRFEQEPIPCEKCGKDFRPESNRQRYCPTCRKAVVREQNRTRKQKARKLAV
jgi:predicted Zn-ribbon and HTH transcriptional regulator